MSAASFIGFSIAKGGRFEDEKPLVHAVGEYSLPAGQITLVAPLCDMHRKVSGQTEPAGNRNVCRTCRKILKARGLTDTR